MLHVNFLQRKCELQDRIEAANRELAAQWLFLRSAMKILKLIQLRKNSEADHHDDDTNGGTKSSSKYFIIFKEDKIVKT